MTDHPSTSWTARYAATVDRLTAGALDVVDLGAQRPVYGPLRHPSDTERDSADGKPSPAGPPGRSSIRPDPTAGRVIAWASDIHATIRRLEELGGTLWFVMRQADIDPPATPPDELPADTVNPATGRVEPVLNPARSRRHILTWRTWLEQLGSTITDGWLNWPPETVEADLWRTLATTIHDHIAAVARQLRPDPPAPSRCDNPHGSYPHPLDEDATASTCTSCIAGDPPRLDEADDYVPADARQCDDRYDYGCTRPLVAEGPRTTTCNSCQQRAYRARKAHAETVR